jgi:Lon protease-like protein
MRHAQTALHLVMDTPPVIPLFPLPIVVLPGELVPLHIFEERYKTMIAACRAEVAAGESGAFGICLVRDDAMFAAGCTVTITRVVRELEDGRLDLVTVGGRRFRVREVFRDRPYLTASVDYFDDAEGEAINTDLRGAVLERFDAVTAKLHLESRAQAIAEDPRASFRIASVALSDLAHKQALLESIAENERLAMLADELDTIITGMERQAEARKVAGSNGKLRTISLPKG